MSDTIRVGVADDHPMFRAGVVSALSDVSDVEMLGEASDAPGAIALSSGAPRRHGPRHRDAGQRPGRSDPHPGLVPRHADRHAHRVRGRGRHPRIGEGWRRRLRPQGRRRVRAIDVIRAVHAGEVYVAPALAWGMLREMSAPRTAPYDELTAREKEVLELVAEGMSNQEIESGWASPRRRSSTT